ncbi:MAG TPA: hypothetical protein VLD67_18595 [Vicinamibacterales bacterium]|nr:hypothetical protein [Vicinamibacterales bacterium]
MTARCLREVRRSYAVRGFRNRWRIQPHHYQSIVCVYLTRASVPASAAGAASGDAIEIPVFIVDDPQVGPFTQVVAEAAPTHTSRCGTSGTAETSSRRAVRVEASGISFERPGTAGASAGSR